MKRVSFKVAKALKEAGYPQGNLVGLHKVKSFPMYYKDDYVPDYEYFYLNYIDFIDKDLMTACPTYLDAWLWLWREKKIAIPADYFGYENNYWSSYVPIGDDKFEFFEPLHDPEEAIIAAIEYLVTNKLLK